MAITITEALAEFKTIGSRIATKQAFIQAHLVRQQQFVDPLTKAGGSKTAVNAEAQAIRDLEERMVQIRRAIQKANDATTVTVGGKTRTLSEWLVWRREVASKTRERLTALRTQLDRVKSDAMRNGVVITDVPTEQDTTKSAGKNILVNIDEVALARDIEALDTILGTLDGQLSLKNATVMVEV